MDPKKTELIAACIACAVFMIIGAGALYFGWHLYAQKSWLLADGVEVTGRIVEFRRIEYDGDIEDDIEPVIRYTTLEDEQGEIVGMWRGFWSDWSVGDEVAVVYDPIDPDRALINNFMNVWAGPVLCGVLGLAFVLIPPLTIWSHYRGERKKRGG